MLVNVILWNYWFGGFGPWRFTPDSNEILIPAKCVSIHIKIFCGTSCLILTDIENNVYLCGTEQSKTIVPETFALVIFIT